MHGSSARRKMANSKMIPPNPNNPGSEEQWLVMNQATATLSTKVAGLEQDVQTLGLRIDGGLEALRRDVTSALRDITGKLDTRGEWKWMLAPAVTFMMFILALVGGLGTMAISPMKEDIMRLRDEAKYNREERAKAIDKLEERDRRLWDHHLKMRSEFDFLRGQLSARGL
jgi:hypothetical protein